MKHILKSLFYSKNKFSPPYMWVTLMMILFLVTWILKLTLVIGARISDTLVIGLAGFIVAWLGIYNWAKHGGPKPPMEA